MRDIYRLVSWYSILLVGLLLLSGCSKKSNGPEASENVPPAAPSNPSPLNNATDQSIEVNIAWSCSDADQNDTLTYAVYFGTNSDPEYKNDINGKTYEPGTLAANTTYFWKIIAKDNHEHSQTGPVWSFTTGDVPNSPPNAPFNPDPAHGANGVSLGEILKWNCNDPDVGDTVTYSIYFSSDSTNLELMAEDQYARRYDPDLELETTYFWKIVAEDSHETTTEGPIWKFTTINELNNPPDAPSIRTEAPDSGSTEQSLFIRLSWYSHDIDDDPLVYNVYFGEENSLELVSEMTPNTRYNTEKLEIATTYYWKIVVYDIHGDSTAGGLWFFTTQTTDPPVMIWYGNPDGENVNANVGERFDLNIYMQTSPEAYVGSMSLAPGANKLYVDSLLNRDEATFYYPITEWQSTSFYSVYEYEPGWFSEAFSGFAMIMPPGVFLHCEVPTMVMTMKMKASDNSDLAGKIVEAFAPGESRYEGPTNVGDTMGNLYDNAGEFYYSLEFNE